MQLELILPENKTEVISQSYESTFYTNNFILFIVLNCIGMRKVTIRKMAISDLAFWHANRFETMTPKQ